MGDFVMPSLGADMAAGTLVKWRVAEGDSVERGDIIAEVETEKGIIEVEVFESGVVRTLLVAPGTKVPVGTPLARIEGPAAAEAESRGATSAPAAESAGAIRGAPRVPASIAAVKPKAPAAPAAPRVKATPLARRLATERGVDLTTVQGTGTGGAIEKADVERVLAARREVGPSSYRRAIAAAMTRANREIPHYYLETDIDAAPLVDWLREENARRGVDARLLPAAPLVKAVALALRDAPDLNGFWTGEGLARSEAIHVGFAIALRGQGLIAPAVHDADRSSLDEVMQKLADLVTRARAGRLRSSELTDPTITVTSLGDLGVERVFGVIYPPQVALVGLGRIRERPWAEQGLLGVRPVLSATLAGDHRATDGRVGARFLEAFARHLSRPEAL